MKIFETNKMEDLINAFNKVKAEEVELKRTNERKALNKMKRRVRKLTFGMIEWNTGKRNNEKNKKEMHCFNCRKIGHLAKDCRGKVKKVNLEVICWKCSEKGHYAKQCKKEK
jgi:hypothetical protein